MRNIFSAVLLVLAWAIPAAAADSQPVVSPQEAMTRLKEGNARFARGYMTTFPFAELRKETAAGPQRPIAMIISCVDSRVTPEYIFNQAPGDLLVIRSPGATQNEGVAGAVEHGAGALGAPLLVVLGHSGCEVVEAAVNKRETENANFQALLRHIEPAVARGRQLAGGDSGQVLDKSVAENVAQSMEELFKASPVVRRLAREKRLNVVGALYNMESGEVRWFGPHPSEQSLIAD